MFVAAIHEFREAVADPSYNATTARERLALTKGLNLDSQLVGKIRDLIIDIDKELHTTPCSFAEASNEDEKKLFMWQTMDYVAYKAFGESKSNESMPAVKDLTASTLRDKETEIGVGCSTTSQGKRQAKRTGERKRKKIKPVLNDVASGKGVSKEHDKFVERTIIDKEEEKKIESDLNDVVNDKDRRKVHNMLYDMLLEGANTDQGKEKQIKPALNDEVNGKGTRKVHNMLYDILEEGATTAKGEEKQIKAVLKDRVNDGGTSKVNDMLGEGATIDKGKEKQSEPVVEGPKKKKRKGKSKKKKMPTDNDKNGNAISKENDDFVEASTLDKGKGKESELLIQGSATDNGKNKDIGLPPAKDEVQGEKDNDDEAKITQKTADLIREVKDLDLGPIPDDVDDAAGHILVKPDSTCQDAHCHDQARKEASMAFRNIHRLLTHAIRPQTAAPYELDLFCRFVEHPPLFELMSGTTVELRWNR